MIKKIIILLIFLMMILPVSGIGHNNPDITGNGVIDVYDTLPIYSQFITQGDYTVYDYWHYYDLNRDFKVDWWDYNLVYSMWGEELPENPIEGYVSTEGYDIPYVSNYYFRAWLIEWNTVNYHLYKSPDYQCMMFSKSLYNSFIEDYNTNAVKQVCSRTHAYNAVYMGGANSDPYLLSNWRFIEPQSDLVYQFKTLPVKGVYGEYTRVYLTSKWSGHHIRWNAGKSYGYFV